MKHILIIGLLLVAAGVVYVSFHKNLSLDSARTVISKVVRGHEPGQGEEVATNASQPVLAPVAPQPTASNTTIATNPATVSIATNTWERVTAGRYADLIKEIRDARGNAQ